MKSEKREAIASATSLNGEVEYTCSMDFTRDLTDSELRAAFRREIVEHVRREYGSTPRGVAYLADTRTITIIRL
jgi:hypothetical protein